MYNDIKNELNNVKTTTDNGAIAYATTGKKILDLNFNVSKLRFSDSNEIFHEFMKAYYEDKELALLWLFYVGDIRNGLGERNIFKSIISNLAIKGSDNDRKFIKEILHYIPVYTRWDYLIDLIYTPVTLEVTDLIKKQLKSDLEHMKKNQSISLLAKWMPSINTSSKETVNKAYRLASDLNMKPSKYRKLIAKLRKYLNVTEVKMCSNDWSNIEYDKVPSKANLKYENAFLVHDTDRRMKYLEDLKSGKTKINSSVLNPCEIYSKYNKSTQVNDTFEEMWKSLPNLLKNTDESIMVVCDGSGSMTWGLNNGMKPIDVSRSLAIYFSERLKGEYKDTFITFSAKPEIVNLEQCKTLKEKIDYVNMFDDCSNTNLELTFDLILNTAVNNNYKQQDLPSTILVISDMEFDQATYRVNTETLMETISNKFKNKGYTMPKLVFWNVNRQMKKSNNIPIKENENGVALVSGYSTNIIKMILSNNLNPWEALKEVLFSDTYKFIRDEIEKIF